MNPLHPLISGGPGQFSLKLFTRSFHSLWTFTQRERTAHQALAGSYCHSQYIPAQPPPYTGPRAPDVPRKSGQLARG